MSIILSCILIGAERLSISDQLEARRYPITVLAGTQASYPWACQTVQICDMTVSEHGVKAASRSVSPDSGYNPYKSAG